MPHFTVTTIDITILVVYVIGTRIAFGWYFARKTQGSTDSYFLAGRTIAWPIIGLSFYVSNMSGSSFVGLPGSGYRLGVAVYNYEWLPAVILVLFAVFMLPLFLRARIFTAPQFLEKRFDRRSRLAFSGFLLLANIFIDAAAALYAGASVAQVLFPQIPIWVTVAVTALIAGGYIFFGGLGAVVFNDAIQAALILIGGAVITVLALTKVSWHEMLTVAPAHGLHLFRPADDPDLPWPGVFTGVFIVGIYFWCTNQFMMQRALGAKSLEHGRWGAIFAGALKLPNLLILVLPGLAARALYPDLKSPDLAFPTLVFDLLPVGLRGLLLASLAAAILSSLESIFNSAATLWTMDFHATFRPQATEAQLVRVGRIATIVFMVLAALWAPQINHFPTLWQYLQSILSYVTPPVVAVFLIGMFWRGATATAAFVTLVIGIPLGAIGWFAGEWKSWIDLQYLYACGVLFVLCIAIMFVVSLLTRPTSSEQTRNLVWHKGCDKDMLTPGTLSIWKDYRVLSVMLLIVTAFIVYIWR